MYASHFTDIDMTNLKTQCDTAKILFAQDNMNVASIQDVVRELNVLKSAFIQLLKLIAISLTLPVLTASNERFFRSKAGENIYSLINRKRKIV